MTTAPTRTMVLISFCWLQEFIDAHHLPENQNNSMKNPRQDKPSTKLVGKTTFREKEVAIGEVVHTFLARSSFSFSISFFLSFPLSSP
jgi:hypothetical protein